VSEWVVVTQEEINRDGQDVQDEKKRIEDLKFEISNLEFIYPAHPW
jgi:hypothetical protein